MKKMHCIVVDDEQHARKLLKKYIEETDCLELVGEYQNAASALAGITEVKPEVIFLDVQMPGKTGIEMLEELDNPEEFIIIFTTAYDQYAITAFENSATDYLLKPFDEERFLIAVEKIKKMQVARSSRLDHIHDLLLKFQLSNKIPDNFFLEKITCKSGNKLRILYVKDVYYIEASGNYCKAYTSNNSFLVNISISELQLKLNPGIFVRTHRSFIVNTHFISSVESHFNGEYNIEMLNKAMLKVSRSYKDGFNKIMGVF